MRIVMGDILDVQPGIICHQVNCQGVMGSGLARQIREQWPQTYLDYRSAFEKGLLSLGSVITSEVSPGLYVAHMCGQDRYGRGKVYTDYPALVTCFGAVLASGKQVYIPYGIGCGLAGGDWDIVSAAIDMYLPDAIIVRFKQEELT